MKKRKIQSSNELRFFRHLEQPFFYMVDDEGGMMITVCCDEKKMASVQYNWDKGHIKRMMAAFVLNNYPVIYGEISEGDFYSVFRKVEELAENNYSLFEKFHFS